MPDEWRYWLKHRGSLTLKLQQAFPGSFAIEVIRHDWGVPMPTERRVLDIQERTKTSIREVLLICNGHPKVFARSIFPVTSLHGRNHRLLRLRDRPLGDILFADPTLKRGKFEVSSVAANVFNPWLSLSYQDEIAWGRRSVFHLSGKPLLVSEFFLPDPR
ncbi:MAG: chorismate lyase [Endozoicomonadaceae bacterium]|nr:chorismate lyase [Endozoicomonadaceae bacterium]